MNAIETATPEQINEFIENLIRSKGLTIKDIEKEVNSSRGYFSRIKKKKILPSIEFLWTVSKKTEVSLDDILCLQDQQLTKKDKEAFQFLTDLQTATDKKYIDWQEYQPEKVPSFFEEGLVTVEFHYHLDEDIDAGLKELFIKCNDDNEQYDYRSLIFEQSEHSYKINKPVLRKPNTILFAKIPGTENKSSVYIVPCLQGHFKEHEDFFEIYIATRAQNETTVVPYYSTSERASNIKVAINRLWYAAFDQAHNIETTDDANDAIIGLSNFLKEQESEEEVKKNEIH